MLMTMTDETKVLYSNKKTVLNMGYAENNEI